MPRKRAAFSRRGTYRHFTDLASTLLNLASDDQKSNLGPAIFGPNPDNGCLDIAPRIGNVDIRARLKNVSAIADAKSTGADVYHFPANDSFSLVDPNHHFTFSGLAQFPTTVQSCLGVRGKIIDGRFLIAVHITTLGWNVL